MCLPWLFIWGKLPCKWKTSFSEDLSQHEIRYGHKTLNTGVIVSLVDFVVVLRSALKLTSVPSLVLFCTDHTADVFVFWTLRQTQNDIRADVRRGEHCFCTCGSSAAALCDWVLLFLRNNIVLFFPLWPITISLNVAVTSARGRERYWK